MKSLRRSVNNSSSSSGAGGMGGVGGSAGGGGGGGPMSPPFTSGSGSSHSSALSRPSEKVAPPQKVIKALTTHRSTNPQQLSYTKGDFWYVTGEREGWYEALNPITGSRGLVPKTDFEEFHKGGRQSAGPGHKSVQSVDERAHTPISSHPSQSSFASPPPEVSPPVSAISAGGTHRKPKQPIYAIVQYDFQAERPDELDAKKGEPIVVIAQSNHEWFVAKPIGRLGGPGLIPVAFVEIRDPATGRPIEVLPDSIPMVEEWKKATADYKAASIPLGRFDFPGGEPQGVANSPYAPSGSGSGAGGSHLSVTQNPNGTAGDHRSSSGHASRSHSRQQGSVSQDNGRYSAGPSVKTRPYSLYRPEQDPLLPHGEILSLSVPSFHNESGNYWFRIQVTFLPDHPNGPLYILTLYRTYEDFYDFQISLLDTFPHEAGRPASDDEAGSPPERILPYMPGPVEDEIDDELTEYRREELDAYVRALVDLREQSAGYILRHELFRGFFAAKYGDYCEEAPRPSGDGQTPPMPRSSGVVGGGTRPEELEERLADVRLGDDRNLKQQHQQPYITDTRATSAASRHSQHNNNNGAAAHDRNGSGSRSGTSRGPSPLPPPIETQRQSRSHSRQQSYADSAGLSQPSQRQSGAAGGQHHQQQPFSAATAPYTAATTASSFSASGALSATGPGAGGAQPPYIKIKIYDRATDDLIAIRVHPNVSHAELFDKVRSRLGNEVKMLRYRTSVDGYRDVRDDRDLRDWMRGEDQKLVLYAEQ